MLPAVFVYIEVKDYVPDTYAGKQPNPKAYFHLGVIHIFVEAKAGVPGLRITSILYMCLEGKLLKPLWISFNLI